MRPLRRLVRLLVCAWLVTTGLTVAAPRAARAQGQELEDVVYLTDGGIMRGTIVEQIPGESILLRTRDGNQLRFQMSQIARMTREAAVAAPAPQPAPQQQPALHGGTKSPGAALFLSFLIPGAGQVYNGQAGKGLLHFALAGAATWTALSGFASDACVGSYYTYWDSWTEQNLTRQTEGGDCGWGFAGLGAALGIHIWSMVDASMSASNINRRARLASVRVEPQLGASRGVRLRVAIRTPALLR